MNKNKRKEKIMSSIDSVHITVKGDASGREINGIFDHFTKQPKGEEHQIPEFIKVAYNPKIHERSNLRGTHFIKFKNDLTIKCSSSRGKGRPVKKVEVLVSLTNGMVEIKIADSGKGIPQHLIDKLGGKGISFGKEGHQTAGSGLGLYHAMTTVKSWGGDLTIASLEGQGTTITIKIPLIAG